MIDPNAPVVRIVDGQIVQRADAIPEQFGNTFPYRAAGEEAWVRDGWRNLTAEELEAEAIASEQAAEAQAAQAQLPAVFPTGLAVLDDSGHHIELIPTGDGLPVIGEQVSNSPLTPAQRAQMKAERRAAHDALKAAAASAKTDKGKVAILMQAVFGIEAV